MRPTTDSEIILQQDHILVFVVVVVDMDALEDKFSTIKNQRKPRLDVYCISIALIQYFIAKYMFMIFSLLIIVMICSFIVFVVFWCVYS